MFTFYGAIVWFVVHWGIYYYTDFFSTPQERVKQEIVADQQAKAAELEKTLATLDDSTLAHEWATKPEVIAAGEVSYLTNCTASVCQLATDYSCGRTNNP